MKSTTARHELVTLVILGIVFLAFLFPSLQEARREYRDGIRRTEVAAFKVLLEQYFNDHETYPLTFDASPHTYVVETRDNEGATGWYLRAQLENHHESESGFDAESGRNYWYRTVNESGHTFYEVCGGELSCGADRPNT